MNSKIRVMSDNNNKISECADHAHIAAHPTSHTLEKGCRIVEDFPIIVISIKGSMERRAAISDALGALDLPFVFYDAIDGRNKLPDQYEREIDRDLTMKRWGCHMSDAEYACALAHVGVYNYILSNNLSGAVVLEDDAILGKNFKQFISKSCYRHYSMIFLAHSQIYAYRWTAKELFPGGTVWKPVTNPSSTVGYSISARVAQKLLLLMKPIHQPADMWPCDLSALGAVVAHPSIVHFDEKGPSMIGSRRIPSSLLVDSQAKQPRFKRCFTLIYLKNKIKKIYMRTRYFYIPASSSKIK